MRGPELPRWLAVHLQHELRPILRARIDGAQPPAGPYRLRRRGTDCLRDLNATTDAKTEDQPPREFFGRVGWAWSLLIPQRGHCDDKRRFVGDREVTCDPQHEIWVCLHPSCVVVVVGLRPAANTPDNRLEIFRVTTGAGLEPVASVPVGLEPVAVAARANGEVWVVNHLSDSVSVVDVSRDRARRAHAAGRRRAARHRVRRPGQPRVHHHRAPRPEHRARSPAHHARASAAPTSGCSTPSTSARRSAGTPLDGITLVRRHAARAGGVARRPHRLRRRLPLRQPDHRRSTERVWSRRTAAVPRRTAIAQGVPQPPTGLIVKYRVDAQDGQLHWLDNVGRRWDDHVKLSLPDKDVFAIDATAKPPVASANGAFSGVGTVLFNMAVNPVSGKVYVTNTDARNDVRFEGHNTFGPTQGAPAGSVRGHIADSRITAIDPSAGQVTPRHLNKHIDFTRDGTPDEAAKSLAFPTGMAVSPDGATLYVAALGSSKVGVFDTKSLEDDSFVPSTDAQIALSGGGPTGLVLDDAGRRAYVLTRFDNAISIVDVRARRELGHVAMFNPEPASVVKGRRFLYDAAFTSSHGDSACASCHIFGDFDSLAWDLGDPDDIVSPIPGPFTIDPAIIAGSHAGTGRTIDHAAQGADDHAEPARHGQPRPDALARRSQRAAPTPPV